MRFLLDTNVCIAILKGNDKVIGCLKKLSPDDCAVSVVTMYELYAGVERCRDPHKEMLALERFLNALHQLPLENKAAQFSAKVRHALEIRGRMIGPYDILLAGQALATGLILVTHNQHEFSRVEGLKIEDWESP